MLYCVRINGEVFFHVQLDSLQDEADRLKDQKPEEAEAIQVKINEMTELWTELKTMVCVFCMYRLHYT